MKALYFYKSHSRTSTTTPNAHPPRRYKQIRPSALSNFSHRRDLFQPTGFLLSYSTSTANPTTNNQNWVVVLLGWLGCSSRNLNKYTQIYGRQITPNSLLEAASQKQKQELKLKHNGGMGGAPLSGSIALEAIQYIPPTVTV